jgi:GT2 family glycosyltransferase
MESELGKFILKSVTSPANLDFDDIQDSAFEYIDSFSLISEPYLLFWDISATIRPDYWSVVHTYCPSIENYKIISGNTIVYDGLSIPYYVGHKPLTGFSETVMNLLPLSSALFQKDIVVKLNNISERFSHFLPENIISQAQDNDFFHLRIPVDVRREPRLLEGEREFYSSQNNLKTNLLEPFKRASLIERPTQALSTKEGFSVIINFRNAVEATNKAITALRMQDYEGNIELILINNGSHISSVNTIKSHAESLFDKEFVKLIDYPFPFNHSAQTDLGVEAASYPLLLMLSNDAYLLSPHCLTRASTILKNPQVGTCGFRIIRQSNNNEFKVESIGLRLALGKLCTLGGQVLQRNIPLDRDINHVIHVAGNTFAAAAVRTDVFKKIGCMDTDRFPTTYNDVEFCLRASSHGLIHIVDGLSIVQHSGRGTREPDLDFPTDPAILKSIHNIDELANGYTLYDFGGLRVF